MLASVDLHFKENIHILMKLLIVSSSAPSHLVFGIYWDLEQKIGILLKHFDKYYWKISM